MPRRTVAPAVAATILLFATTFVSPAAARAQQPACDPDNAGLKLPDGFCALVVADTLGRARHLAVAPNGDVFVALRPPRGVGPVADFAVLRDTDGDGRADVIRRHGSSGGTGVRLHAGFVYFGADDAIIRYPWRPGALEPTGEPDTIVRGLPGCCGHQAKGFVIDREGFVYVNVGSPSNACQEGQGRQPGVAGQDPCPQLETWAGIWRFRADRTSQNQSDGIRYATGLRNTFALDLQPGTGALYGGQHGRDQLSQLWPALFTAAQSANKPGEEFVRIEQGDDFGWPYCYYDPELRLKVLAPEYGGDGHTQGRCARAKGPALAFPAHWAPNALVFYPGETGFPSSYWGGAFIAFHGSWNRAPLPQGGYQVVFVRFDEGAPAAWEPFAEGFAGADASPRGAAHRPAGLAVGPDGSLYVADDQGGRIYRILYRGR